jgi:chromosome segregation ATPase
MVGLMKYFRLMVMNSLFLHSIILIGGDSYIPLPPLYEVVDEGSISEIKDFVQDNQGACMVGSVALLLTGATFLKRDKIQIFCKQKYEAFKQDVYKDVVDAKGQVDSQVNQNVPAFVQAAAKKIFAWALGPITGTLKDYWTYNKLHVYAATFFSFGGWITSHPIVGGGIGGVTLAAGYLGQAYKMLKKLKEQAEKHFEALKLQAQRNKEELVEEIGELSNEINTVKKEIQATLTQAQQSIENKVEVENKKLEQTMIQHGVIIKNEIKADLDVLGDDIHKKIDQSNQKIEGQLKGLSGQLNTVTIECLSLTGKFDALHKDNAIRDEKSTMLANRLEQASTDLLSAKADFSLLSDTLISQMTMFTTKTDKQLKSFIQNAVQQLDGMQSKIDRQAKDVSGIKCEVSQLLGKVFESHSLITVLQKVQAEDNQKLIGLDDMLAKISSKNTLQFELISNIASQHDKGMLTFTSKLDLLDTAQSKLQTSFDGFFMKFEAMESEIAQLKKENEKAEKERNELKIMLLQTRTESAESMSKLRKDLYAVADDLKKDIRKSKEETNFLIKTSFAAVPLIGISDSPGNNHFLPLVEKLPKKQNYFLPLNMYNQQSLVTQRVLVAVLGSALQQQYARLNYINYS